MAAGGEIDPTWTGATEPAPVATRIPADEAGVALSPPPRSRGWLIGAAATVLLLALGGLFLASEAGLITLGIERWWGASNRPAEALADAAQEIAAAGRYAAHGELVLTWATVPTLPLLEPVTNADPAAGATEEAPVQLTIRFTQQTASEGTLIETEWLPDVSPAVAAQLAPFFTRDRVRLDLFIAGESLFLRLPEDKDGGWVRMQLAELAALDAGAPTWEAILSALGKELTDGRRVLGRTIDGVRAKGYEATTRAAGIQALLSPKSSAGSSNALTLKPFYVGRSDRRPYGLIANGQFGAVTVAGTVAFRQFDGAIVVAPPTDAAQTKLGDWLVARGLIARTPAAARDAERVADLGRIADALAHVATESHPYRYPKVEGVVKLEESSEVGQALVRVLGDLPTDPLAPTRYYGYASDGTTYRVTAVLEDADHPAGTKEGELTLLVRTP
ncbi:MAG: hypothetical protein ACOYBJ_02080 [Patescibacteria group bacterium]|jgi:hypothetical protein